MPIKIGLQLFSVRQSLAKDPWGTLAGVARAGFTDLEAANHHATTDPGVGFGVGAGELRQRLADLGLSIHGCHINPLTPDVLPRALDYQAELGNKQFGCDIEFFPRNDLDYVKRRCDFFNATGQLARERGMRFYYHNHFQEFQTIAGKTVYELVMEYTDPSLVYIEMDTYWVCRGGQDPLAWMKRYADRIIVLHQKDFPAGAPQPLNLYDGVVSRDEPIDMAVFEARKVVRCFTEIGTGILPIQDIIDAASTLPHLTHIILEQDHTALDELDSIRVSHDAFFSKFMGVV